MNDLYMIVGLVAVWAGILTGGLLAIAVAVLITPGLFIFLQHWITKGWQAAMRQAGYYKVDYGFACGRHWISFDGKMIAQTSGDDVWLRDEDVHRLGYVLLDHGKHWSAPDGLSHDIGNRP